MQSSRAPRAGSVARLACLPAALLIACGSSVGDRPSTPAAPPADPVHPERLVAMVYATLRVLGSVPADGTGYREQATGEGCEGGGAYTFEARQGIGRWHGCIYETAEGSRYRCDGEARVREASAGGGAPPVRRVVFDVDMARVANGATDPFVLAGTSTELAGARVVTIGAHFPDRGLVALGHLPPRGVDGPASVLVLDADRTHRCELDGVSGNSEAALAAACGL